MTIVVHVDVDTFFAQVEELRLGVAGSRPLGVQQNMEVASVNYAARECGLYNRISVSEAKRLCPTLLLVRGDNGVNGMQRYRHASQRVLKAIMSALDALPDVSIAWPGRRVEQASFDDFYILLPEAIDTWSAAETWGKQLRTAVRDTVGLRVSVGIGRTKLLAMLATKRAKPDGLHSCNSDSAERALLDAARIDALRGAGLVGVRPPARAALVGALGDGATVAEAREQLERDETGLVTLLGVADAAALKKLLACGCDDSAVGTFMLPKSLSVECSVRHGDSETEPATTVAQVGAGYARLAPLLLSRLDDDEETYGRRTPAHLVVKWKLSPKAAEVRQVQVAWPAAPTGEDAEGGTFEQTLAAHATRSFASANARQPFQRDLAKQLNERQRKQLGLEHLVSRRPEEGSCEVTRVAASGRERQASSGNKSVASRGGGLDSWLVKK